MKTNFFKILLVANFVILSQALAQIESGGYTKSELIYECTEKNPKDPSIPIEAILTKELDDVLLLRVGTKLNTPFEVQMIYTNDVTQNKDIRCLIACEIFENQHDKVSFGVTIWPNEIQGQFTGRQLLIDFSCVKKTK